ncbi:MAG: hypothetical protein WC273_03785 [Dehalococcoidia bacterium]
MTRRALRAIVCASIAAATVALVVVALPFEALAQRAAPTIQATTIFDPPSAAIGDRVTLLVRATHPDDVVVKAAAPRIEHVDVVTTIPPVPAPAGPGTQMTTFAFTMQAFVLGTVDTGTVRISWLRADGGGGNVDVTGAKLAIVPVRAANDQALRPLKPQESIAGGPAGWVRPAIAAVIVVMLALLALAAAAFVSRRRAPAPAEVAPEDTSPEGVARRALDGLGVHAQPAHLDYQSYYGGLAVTVRTYLAARFGFNAHALTTTELERRMISHGVDRWQARLVGGLLERCDDAVYARRYPDPASADHDLTVAYEIVELSRPRPALEGQAALA